MKKLAPFMIVLSGVLWGTMGIYVRVLNAVGIHSLQIVLLRGILTALITGILILFTDKTQFRVKLKDLWILVCGGLGSILFFNASYFKAIEITSMAAACVLMYTSPVFVTVLSAIIFRDKITPRKIAAMVLVFLGCALVGGIASGEFLVTPLGLMYGLFAGIGYALYSIFSRIAINRGYSTMTITFYNFLFAGLGCVFITDTAPIAEALGGNGLAIVMTIACSVIATVIPYLLYTQGLKYVENSKAAVIVAIEPVTAAVIGTVLYKEKLTLAAIVGIALVLLSIAILSGREKKRV